MVDAGRAGFGTSGAVGAGKRLARIAGVVLQKRRDDRTHGAGINRAVGVAANALVDRADVEAGPAADAAQDGAQLGIGQDVRAAVVQDDQMHFLGAIAFALAPRAGEKGQVHGQGLAGGGRRQDVQDHSGVGQGLHHFFQGHERNVDRRARAGQPDVAFVFQHRHRAGLGDGDVAAGDAGVGGQKLLSQAVPGDAGHLRDVGAGAAELAGEKVGDLLLGHVQGRSQDMRGALAGQLDDVLAKVGLHGLNAGGLENLVEPHLLAHHGLALDHEPHPALGQDAGHKRGGRGSRFGVVHPAAGGDDAGFKLFQQLRQLGQGLVAHGHGPGLALGEVGHGVDRTLAQHADVADGLVQDGPALAVAKGLGRSLGEIVGSLGHMPSPARTSARCRALIGRSRLAMAEAMLSRQLGSAVMTASAPLATMSSIFSETMASLASG